MDMDSLTHFDWRSMLERGQQIRINVVITGWLKRGGNSYFQLDFLKNRYNEALCNLGQVHLRFDIDPDSLFEIGSLWKAH